MEAPEAVDGISDGDKVTVDADTGIIVNETTGKTYQAQPFPPFVKDIIEKGRAVIEAAQGEGSRSVGPSPQRICLLPGDGIGPEITAEAVKASAPSARGTA